MPNLKRSVDDLESVEEKYRPLYDEKDGKYVLDSSVTLEGFIADSEVDGLRKNKDEILAEFKKFKAKYEGIDPEKVAELQKLADEYEKKKKKGEGDIEAIERQLTEKFEKELSKRDDEITGHRSTIEKLMIDNEATKAIAEHKGNVKVLLPHVKNASRCVQDDEGDWRVEILDSETGRPKISPGKASKLMSITEFVEELKDSDDFAMCFEGNGATGGGATGSQGSGSGVVALRGDDRKDPAAYRRARAEAEKRGLDGVTLQE